MLRGLFREPARRLFLQIFRQLRECSLHSDKYLTPAPGTLFSRQQMSTEKTADNRMLATSY